jgi:hypothetical protein
MMNRSELEAAVKSGANLCSADLRDVNLCGAKLCGANLCGANLCGANLCGANLRGADLRDADLWGANLRDADLRDADLRDANLCSADLRDANLRDANLCSADLRDVNLCDADLGGQWIIQGAMRSDGYPFMLQMLTGDKEPIVRAGCRRFTVAQAQAHWKETRGGTPLGDETEIILRYLVALAVVRKLMPTNGED